MDEMLLSYRQTKVLLTKSKRAALEEKARIQKRIVRNKECEADDPELSFIKEQISLLNRMLSDVQLAIDWLRLGHYPGPRRGINRKSLDQLTIPVDPLRMQSFANPQACGSPTTLSDSERHQIEDALSTLSKRERECYILKYGRCLSLQQIADELQITKGTVQDYIEKAESKIKEAVQTSLFLICG